MRRLLSLFISVIVMVALTGCTGSSNEEKDQLARIQEAGKIVIGTEGTWAPWTYHDTTGKLTGYDVEVMRAIAEKLGVEAEFKEGCWDGLLQGVGTRFDLIANGVDVTEERQGAYDFTIPYAYNRTVLVVAEGNDEIKDFTDLKGKVAANSIGSTYELLATEYGATTEGVENLADCMQMLMDGRIDFFLNSESSVQDYFLERPDATVKIVNKTEDALSIAFPLPKGDDSKTLREAINKAIQELAEDGTLTRLSEQFFHGSDISK